MKFENYSIQKLRKITLYRDDMNGRIKISSDTVHKDEDFLEKDLVLFSDVQKLIDGIEEEIFITEIPIRERIKELELENEELRKRIERFERTIEKIIDRY